MRINETNRVGRPAEYRPTAHADISSQEPRDHYQPSGTAYSDPMRDLAKAQGAARAAALPSQRAMDAAKRMGLSFGPDGKPKPLTRDEMRKLAESLDKLPPKLLAQLEKEGVKIELHDKMPEGSAPKAEGQYFPENKRIKLLRGGLEAVPTPPGKTNVLLHELGHAVDDMLVKGDTPDNVTRYTDSREFIRDFTNHGFQVEGIGQPAHPEKKLTDYSLTNQREYFSEGFRMYLQSPETRAQLQQRDPKLFQRLQSILGPG
ncbi:MAG: zinc-dependent peptidase [Vulcanimicrobiota bacterium]